MISLHRRLPERFVLLNGCFNFRNLDPGLAAGLLSQAKLAITDGYRGPDGQGPVRTRPQGSCRGGTGRPARRLPRRGVNRAR